MKAHGGRRATEMRQILQHTEIKQPLSSAVKLSGDLQLKLHLIELEKEIINI